MKKSKKNQLIEAMIRSSRPWKFTEMQRFVWNLSNPEKPFTRENRGYWATNFNGYHGHLRSGGHGEIYKTDLGWFAKWTKPLNSQVETL